LAPADLSRRAGVLVALWALAVGAFALNHFLVGVFYDDGLYAGIATALATGQGYVHPHLPGSPAVIHYPPLYPLVLAPLFGLLPVATAGFVGKILNLIFAAAAAGLIAAHATRIRLLGDRAPVWLAGVLVAAAAVAVPVLTTQSVLFAEPLFALLLALTVTLADRAGTEGNARLARWAGVGAALTLLTRTVGIAAGGGVALFLTLRGQRRAAVHAMIPVAIAAVVWLAWTVTQRAGIDPALAINYGSYGEVLRQTGLGALGSSTLDLPRPLVAITLGWLGKSTIVIEVLAVAIGLYGLWLCCRRSSIGFTLLGYLAILAIWPFPPDRFLWAVLPWIGLVFTAGAVDLFVRRWSRIPAAVVTLAALIGFLIYHGRSLPRRSWATQAAVISANFRELIPAIRELPDSAIVAVDGEAMVWLYTGRRCVPLYVYGYEGARETMPPVAEHRAYLERQGVTHIALASASSLSARELRALIGAYPGWLEPVHAWPGGRWIFAARAGRGGR
jgi:hypothetical protein